MPMLIGAVAYRASLRDKVEEWMDPLKTPSDHDGGVSPTHVLCPKCSEPYILVEGLDATGDILQDDMEFLAKALSTGHPLHPAHMVIRDPDGVLCRHFNLQSTAAAEKIREEAASCEVLTQP